jgi:hypothetical protein
MRDDFHVEVFGFEWAGMAKYIRARGSLSSSAGSAIQLFVSPDPKSVNTGIGAVVRACANNDMSKPADINQIFDDSGPKWPKERNVVWRRRRA